MDIHKKKETGEGESKKETGGQWVSAAIEPESKVIVATRRGSRDEASLKTLLEQVERRVENPLAVLYVSDEWDAYGAALRSIFGESYQPEKKPGRGRPPKPRIMIPGELKHAVVHKTREKGRVVKVERKIVFGNEGAIMDILDKSPVSNTLNTSFIERFNLTFRHTNKRLTRKTPGFSKKGDCLDAQLILSKCYYHFILPHGGLEIKRDGEKNIQRTPFMAAGFTGKIWSMEEFLKHVPAN